MKEIKINSNYDLECPNCNECLLCDELIDHYYRNIEDDKHSRRTSICNKKVEINIVNSIENPSMRRDGIRVIFSCENCNSKPILNIRQNKGSTEIYWDD